MKTGFMNINFTAKAIAYGTPPLLILIGSSMYMSGKFFEPLLNTSDVSGVGIILLSIGILMGIAELVLKFR